MQAMKALASHCICTGSPELSLLDNAVSTVNSEMFARDLILRTKFCENKALKK